MIIIIIIVVIIIMIIITIMIIIIIVIIIIVIIIMSIKTKTKSNHFGFLQVRLFYVLCTKEKDLPLMYWIPKIHKNAYRKKFIIASKLCSTKQLSKSISSAIKLIYNSNENFHEKSCDKFRILKNCDLILNSIIEKNKIKNTKCIST